MLDNDQIFATIDLGLIALDHELIVRGWNRWMEIHSGVSAIEIIGQSILDRYPNLGEAKYIRLFKSVISFGSYACFSQKLHQYLIPIANPHPSRCQLPLMQQSCSANPLRDSGGRITGLYITVQDVTEYAIYEKKLLQLTRIDFLTKLYNRRFIDKRLTEELERCRRFGNPLSLILIDIDFFKKINDIHGHLCGDNTLRSVASILMRMVRVVDIVGRYGGEEFCCILPETCSASAYVLAERLRLEIATEVFTFGDVHFNLTISLGVAEYNERTSSLETLVRQADEALYQAKKEGRNRVACAGTDNQTPTITVQKCQ